MNRIGPAALCLMLLAVGCNQHRPSVPKQLQQPELSQGSGNNGAAGIKWSLPSGWVAQPARQMRVATYSVPAAGGDAEGAECAVFYFGGGQGGDVEANISRWVGQFESAGEPVRSSREVNGMNVSLVQIAGTYLAPGGPMMQSQGKKENYRLLGAIVAGPEGSVFFKFTGPSRTVTAAEKDFDALIGTLSKQ
jgi:hypothetical protein